MKESFRQCMAWLHTWTGLTTGWVLFFVFVTGTAGYVDDEITRWMRPELPYAAVQRGQGLARAFPEIPATGGLPRGGGDGRVRVDQRGGRSGGLIAAPAAAGKPDIKLCAAPMIPRYAWRLDGLPSPSK
jgi:hypothetical protein